MSNRGNKGPSGPRPSMGQQLLNLERVPALAPKFANKLGKTCDGYAIIYTGGGVSVQVQSLLGKDGSVLENAEKVDLVDFERRVALHNQPTAADRLSAIKRKYELRLEKEFPEKGPKSGSDADIQAWLGTLPLGERLALLKSQKKFEADASKGTPK